MFRKKLNVNWNKLFFIINEIITITTIFSGLILICYAFDYLISLFIVQENIRTVILVIILIPFVKSLIRYIDTSYNNFKKFNKK